MPVARAEQVARRAINLLDPGSMFSTAAGWTHGHVLGRSPPSHGSAMEALLMHGIGSNRVLMPLAQAVAVAGPVASGNGGLLQRLRLAEPNGIAQHPRDALRGWAARPAVTGFHIVGDDTVVGVGRVRSSRR